MYTQRDEVRVNVEYARADLEFMRPQTSTSSSDQYGVLGVKTTRDAMPDQTPDNKRDLPRWEKGLRANEVVFDIRASTSMQTSGDLVEQSIEETHSEYVVVLQTHRIHRGGNREKKIRSGRLVDFGLLTEAHSPPPTCTAPNRKRSKLPGSLAVWQSGVL